MRVLGGVLAAALLASLMGTVQAEDSPAWSLRIGHSYSSQSALRQPATFELSADLGRPTLSKLDVGFLVAGAYGGNGKFELGGRASGGSVRPRPQRVFGGMLRTWKSWDPVVVTLGAEYDADGGFDVQKGQLTVETTPMRGLPALGVWAGPGLRIRWRPWFGVGYGNVFSTDAKVEDIEAGGFWRAHARVEFHYRAGQPAPAKADPAKSIDRESADSARAGRTDSSRARFDLEATGWVLFDDPRGEGYVTAALSVPLGSGLALVASGEAGRQPPRFELTRRVGLGLGFSY
jgi:hypothetical protein